MVQTTDLYFTYNLTEEEKNSLNTGSITTLHTDIKNYITTKYTVLNASINSNYTTLNNSINTNSLTLSNYITTNYTVLNNLINSNYTTQNNVIASGFIKNGNYLYYTGGFVGIGLSNPEYILDVNGNIRFTGTSNLSGIINTGSITMTSNGLTAIFFKSGSKPSLSIGITPSKTASTPSGISRQSNTACRPSTSSIIS